MEIDLIEHVHICTRQQFLPREAVLNAVHAVLVCVPIRPTQTSVLSKWLNGSRRKQHHMVA